jgi:DNA-binding NarL/FixJ family response regulator
VRKLRILIVDDQKLFSDSLKRVLVAEKDDIESVATSPNGEAALREISAAAPDIVLMDVHMPVMNGIEATRLVHKRFPGVKILILSAFGYDDYVKTALENGAVGYLLKDISPAELLKSLQAASAGLRIISPRVLDRGTRRSSQAARQSSAPAWFHELTGRERDVLFLVVKGYSNEEIAEMLSLGMQTVKNYLSSIYGKLDVKNRFQAMRLAMEGRFDSHHILTVELRQLEGQPGRGDGAG